MENITLRREATLQALATFKESLALIKTDEAKKFHRTFRDSVIQRFEYTFDTFWKYCALFLLSIKKTSLSKLGSPRTIFALLLQETLISEQELKVLYRMLEHRNCSTHMYREAVAQEVFDATQEYCNLIESIINKLMEDIPH